MYFWCFSGRSVHWLARFPHFPFLWRWHWLWVHVTAYGTAVSWLWQEVQAWICYLPCPTDRNSCCGALQLHSYHPYHTWAFWLCFHGGQRGHIWHLPPELGHWEAHLYQSEPTNWTDCVLNHGFSTIRRCSKCWLDRIPGIGWFVFWNVSF